MEVERINDRTIRVIIHKDDLEGRGIEFLDLLGDHKQVEKFFHSILEELDDVEDFTASDAVTFQIMPNEDGIEVIITLRDFDELGQPDDITHFLEMLQSQSQQLDFLTKEVASNLGQSTSDQTDEPDKPTESTKVTAEKPEETSRVKQVTCLADDIEPMILLAKDNLIENAKTSLYALPDASGYAMLIEFDKDYFVGEDYQEVALTLSEYVQVSSLSKEWLDEYGKLLIEQDAVGCLKRSFA